MGFNVCYEYERCFSILRKPFFLQSKEKRFGRIVNVSSIAAKQGGGLFGTAHYAATKAGILGFFKSSREILGTWDNRQFRCSWPYGYNYYSRNDRQNYRQGINKQIPLKRAGKNEEVAATIAFLASDEASYITGEEIDVNGGLLMD